MDIAAFVGLAASGPLNIPVAIEDPAHFRDIFGGDFPLVWDPAHGRMQSAYLTPAVESFFRNGGRRCYVVRVAENPATNRFPLPGLVRADNFRPALARARAPGSWSDNFSSGTVLHSETIKLVNFSGQAGKWRLDIAQPSSQVRPGDLIRLKFGDTGPVVYLAAESVDPLPSNFTTHTSPNLIAIKSTRSRWFMRQYISSPPTEAVRAFLLLPDKNLRLPLVEVKLPDRKGQPYRVLLNQPLGQAPEPGQLMRIDFADGGFLLLPVTRSVSADGGQSPAGLNVEISADEGYWPLESPQEEEYVKTWMTSLSPPEMISAERLTFEILVWEGESLLARLNSLAFSQDHLRFWARLPNDQQLFKIPQVTAASDNAIPFAAEVVDPRFPVAGAKKPSHFYLPLGMPFAPEPGLSQIPLDHPTPDTALQRDGLKAFNAGLFLDLNLSSFGGNLLLAEAHHRRYILGLPLTGLHSLLPIEEVTLIAIPDAVHRGWEVTETTAAEPLAAPTLALRPLTDPYTLSWSAVHGTAIYNLQGATDPGFSQPVALYDGRETDTKLGRFKNCPDVFFYRVRASMGTRVSPWSNTITALIPGSDFWDCRDGLLPAPKLELACISLPPDGHYVLQWTAIDGAVNYALQSAADPAFIDGRTIYVGPAAFYEIEFRDDAAAYYRVRAQNDANSPWSNTQIVSPLSRQRTTLKPAADYDDRHLLAVQTAILNFCAARGDLFAVLNLPHHWRGPDAVVYVSNLKSAIAGRQADGTYSVRPLSEGEISALSFGAVYYPWLTIQKDDSLDDYTTGPADGAICGLLAERALVRGAWIAPANQVLRDVITLEPAVALDMRLLLQRAGINLVRQEPRGFMVLSADTLSQAADLRPINVRRLLILLRRLALREGARYAFEPNNQAFRRLVQTGFETLLENLYVRGAFAGATAADAYRVITDDTVNPPRSVEQGRFVVELRVAPSQPLKYLTIRLVQTSERTFVTETR
jgi:hypothetical protein